jgi:hypothetical protein
VRQCAPKPVAVGHGYGRARRYVFLAESFTRHFELERQPRVAQRLALADRLAWLEDAGGVRLALIRCTRTNGASPTRLRRNSIASAFAELSLLCRAIASWAVTAPAALRSYAQPL